MPVIYEDARGFRTGTVTAGGNISISGNILAEKGSVLDVSGTSGILDLVPGFSGLQPSPLNGSILGQPRIATQVDTNAGHIVLKGGQFLFTDATLRGLSGERGRSAAVSIFPRAYFKIQISC